MSKKVLTRTAILNVSDLLVEEVEVPEWGGVVYVRGLTGAERDAYEQELITWVGTGKNQTARANMSNARAKLAARAICDENGERLFSDGDIKALSAKSAVALQRVFDLAMRLSGMSEDDVEGLVEGLKGDPNGASGSS